jgi:protoheme IX farnesyltransferase
VGQYKPFEFSTDPMTAARAIMDPPARRALPSKLRDYYTLTKPEVNLLILMTTSAGYYLGSQGPLRAGRLLLTLVGTLLVASGTATLNQWMERRYDAQMRRTANRPLVSGRLSSREACWFGLSLSLAGGTLLAVSVNVLSALLAIGTLLGYLLVYTPLKRKTPLCTLLGAVPGAMPTLIGWAASAGGIGHDAWLLFGILFLWQFPHFLAIALMYREDYAGAGFRMLPQFDDDGRFTKAEIVAFTLVLITVTMLPLAGRGGAIYSLIMFTAGAVFLYHTAKLARSGSRVLAGRVVHASVIYLPVVLGTMMAWKT